MTSHSFENINYKLVEPGKEITLGDKLRYYRFRGSKTLKEVSESVGMSLSYLSEIERGKTTPSLSTLQRLSDFYGVSLSLMLSGVRISVKEEHDPVQ